MGIYRIKTYCFVVIFLFGCNTGENFKAINSNKNYTFSYNGFEKSLFLDEEVKNFALVFFTKDCGVCKEQIPILENLARNNIFDIFIVLADAQNQQDALNWANAKRLTLPMFYEKKAVYFFSKAVENIYGVPVISFFKDSKMHKKFIGLTPLSVLENEFKQISFKNL
ncbi:thioredoxin [Campylobacter sp. MIT 21-1685]|uniref:TlpA family protein disulfide reductase n=1 Tax=unclassified Campylobacter TaxID=2593542 RepID=UPI00224ACF9D|nr:MULTISPECIES: conjugal transfer protein TraF [unclassified Campylobacter]MCX2682595.1 thioredoxin [Campylobacter sp. MIT 21-1684]MCX2750875.1 thioredoxin [Campylobacter sp. MIT 21-1682]MCX2807192.1 thioredoxin [Campylobacter sp. MIT 21-1685]